MTAERLRELLNYDPETGLFTWRVDRGGTARVGAIAGLRDAADGYIRIKVDGRRYKAHHLVRLYVRGKWPEAGYMTDHVNGNRADNRLANLRHATFSQNAANRKAPTTNTSCFKGVCFHQRIGKWQKRHHLGYFDTAEAAHAAYCAAAQKYHGRFARAA